MNPRSDQATNRTTEYNAEHTIEYNVERDIDRILTALANTPLPTHLEHRVLAALQARPIPAPRWSFWIPWSRSRHPILHASLALSAAALVVAIFALAARNSVNPSHNPVTLSHNSGNLSHNLSHNMAGPSLSSGGGSSTSGGPSFGALAKGQGPHRASSARWGGAWGVVPRTTALSSSPAAPVILSGAAPSVGSAVEGSRSSPHHRSVSSLSDLAIRNSTQSRAHSRTILCDCDPTALAEANAPSQLAPPLPLTPQEKLLLRIAHHPGSVELAELDPVQREASLAEEQAAYKHFFHTQAAPPAATPSPEAPSEPEAAPLPQETNSATNFN